MELIGRVKIKLKHFLNPKKIIHMEIEADVFVAVDEQVAQDLIWVTSIEIPYNFARHFLI